MKIKKIYAQLLCKFFTHKLSQTSVEIYKIIISVNLSRARENHFFT